MAKNRSARNAGIPSIWIKVAGSKEPDVVEPDATISALMELPGVLKRLETGGAGA